MILFILICVVSGETVLHEHVKKAYVGESVLLTCVKGDSYHWAYMKTPLSPVTMLRTKRESKQLVNLHLSDHGIYTCMSDRGAEGIVYMAYHLQVHGAQQNTCTTHYIHSVVDESLSVPCLKSGVATRHNEHYNTTHLIVTSMQHNKTYECDKCTKYVVHLERNGLYKKTECGRGACFDVLYRNSFVRKGETVLLGCDYTANTRVTINQSTMMACDGGRFIHNITALPNMKSASVVTRRMFAGNEFDTGCEKLNGSRNEAECNGTIYKMIVDAQSSENNTIVRRHMLVKSGAHVTLICNDSMNWVYYTFADFINEPKKMKSHILSMPDFNSFGVYYCLDRGFTRAWYDIQSDDIYAPNVVASSGLVAMLALVCINMYCRRASH